MSRRTIRIILLSMCVVVTAAFMPGINDTGNVYAASKTKKMTAYRNTLKAGNIVYCTNGITIYKVNLSNSSVKKLTTSKIGYTTYLKKKGNYLYYLEMTQYGAGCRISRINLKTGKRTTLAKNTGPEYAISGKKIYYRYAKVTDNDFKYYKRVMKLNGKTKKKTKYKASINSKLTNANGYKVIADLDPDDWSRVEYTNYYLKTPNEDIFLEYTHLII